VTVYETRPRQYWYFKQRIFKYIQGIRKEILQSAVAFFDRYCRTVLKFIMVNYSVSRLTSND
jgi:hypothetical protein